MMSLLNRGGATIFVGDGLSDKYAASTADLVFAKDKLADYCRKEQIRHLPYSNLDDVAVQLEELLDSNIATASEAIEETGA